MLIYFDVRFQAEKEQNQRPIRNGWGKVHAYLVGVLGRTPVLLYPLPVLDVIQKMSIRTLCGVYDGQDI